MTVQPEHFQSSSLVDPFDSKTLPDPLPPGEREPVRRVPSPPWEEGQGEGFIRLVLAGVCVLLLSDGCGSASPDTTATPAAGALKLATVRTAEVTEANVTPETTLIGSVTPVRVSIVGSPVEGRVVRIDVNEGDEIGSSPASDDALGEPIAQLDTEFVLIDLATARAEQKRLEHELEELQAGSRPEEIAQTKARFEAARDASEFADSRVDRIQELVRQNAISGEQLDAAKSEAFAARQELLAATAAHSLAIAGTRKERIAQTTAKVEGQKQAVSRLETQLRDHTIRTPFAGHVVSKLTEVGQWVERGAPVAEIIELDPIDVVVHVPETLVTQLEVGDRVPLTFDAISSESRSLEGTIHGIVSSADQRSRTFPVRIRVANPSHDGKYLLRAGMQARATIAGRSRPMLLIPKDALILGGPEKTVMVAHSERGQAPVAVRVAVETGVSRDDHIEVRGDLQAGQQVVVDGNERVQPGQTLRLVSELFEDSESSD